jgi:hypothetical protein
MKLLSYKNWKTISKNAEQSLTLFYFGTLSRFCRETRTVRLPLRQIDVQAAAVLDENLLAVDDRLARGRLKLAIGAIWL